MARAPIAHADFPREYDPRVFSSRRPGVTPPSLRETRRFPAPAVAVLDRKQGQGHTGVRCARVPKSLVSTAARIELVAAIRSVRSPWVEGREARPVACRVLIVVMDVRVGWGRSYG